MKKKEQGGLSASTGMKKMMHSSSLLSGELRGYVDNFYQQSVIFDKK
jgi:hypothetical protein